MARGKALPHKVDYRGRGGIPQHIKEGVIQMYAVTPNKAEVARAFGLSISSVYKILGKKDPDEMREERHEALAQIASKMTENVVRLVDDISVPPEDATYMQKATVMGITADKLVAIDKQLESHKREDQGIMAMLPENMEAMIGVIRNDIKSFGVMIGVRLVDDAIAEAKKLEDQIGARLVEVEGAEVKKLSDLDVGGV